MSLVVRFRMFEMSGIIAACITIAWSNAIYGVAAFCISASFYGFYLRSRLRKIMRHRAAALRASRRFVAQRENQLRSRAAHSRDSADLQPE